MRFRTRVNYMGFSKRRRRGYKWVRGLWRGFCRCGRLTLMLPGSFRIIERPGIDHFCNPLEAPGSGMQLIFGGIGR